MFSSPHGDFSFSIGFTGTVTEYECVFVPSRGFLFFYGFLRTLPDLPGYQFSSPHGDFSFSIRFLEAYHVISDRFSSPHGDFSFSILRPKSYPSIRLFVFVPSRGFLFFYSAILDLEHPCEPFSSPHGDFSFSILSHIPLINQGLFL